ncbi:UNVERIFIED_CONTAM: hypothetical protein Sradi_4284100 [Sesamum radiatum]|uniref:Uncharacterized protein n=1 Tax=Sesamum radiatum TaxID=300843 RepID=A0AAW2NNR7_SESRA
MYGFCVPAQGKSGGLAVLWVKSVNVQLQSYSQNHIDLSVQLENSQDCWRFTGIYGEPECEKQGGPRRPSWQMQKFRNSLLSCGLSDLGFQGSPFTWTNRHPHPHTVHERLDRACVSQGWSQLFPDASVTHLHVNCSDHKALLVRLEDTPIFSSHRSRPWRFEAAWLHSDQCEQIVAKSWGRCLGPSTLEGVAAHIAACRADLSLWSKTVLKADKGNKNDLKLNFKD